MRQFYNNLETDGEKIDFLENLMMENAILHEALPQLQLILNEETILTELNLLSKIDFNNFTILDDFARIDERGKVVSLNEFQIPDLLLDNAELILQTALDLLK